MSEPQAYEPTTEIPLADTLRTLRQELHLAQARSAGEGILFRIDRVELELKVVISERAKGEAGIKFYVVKAGGEVEKSGETTHTVKLTLSPVDADTRDPVQVSSRSSEEPSRR